MIRRILALACLLAAVLTTCAGKHKDDGPVVAAYVTGWNEFKELPDCSVLTHINYAFGNVNKTYDGVTVQHPERLRQLVGLKKDNKIYIVLSIGGWTAGGFSEMASTERRRKAFAKDCKRIVKEYDLDGIDIDWEYPSCSEAGSLSGMLSSGFPDHPERKIPECHKDGQLVLVHFLFPFQIIPS